MADTKKTKKASIAPVKNIWRLDESYTSLLLGIFVVIVAAILLVVIIKNSQQRNLRKETSSISIAPSSAVYNIPLTITPTPSAQGTKAPVLGKIYTVKSGDNLWNIAQATYGSGYNWTDIAHANKLQNPDQLYAGMKLTLPRVAAKISTLENSNINIPQYGSKITSNTYTVQKGDSLWTISQRAYNGDGTHWMHIAATNHLTNPNLIYSGNILTLPRP